VVLTMEAYTFGSPQGVAALRRALAANPGEGHEQTFGPRAACEFALALETADFAGNRWAEEYTGEPVERAALWPPYFSEMNLTTSQVLTLVDAMILAWELGDESAGQWLSDMAECVDIEWI
jgi:hypothetical protein